MENSSESGWQESGWQRSGSTSRGLNSSAASSRNPRRIPDSSTVRLSGEKGVLGNSNRAESQFGYFREGDGAVIRPVEVKDVSLRQWLDNSERVVNGLDCLHIFMQIVEIVNLAHSQGIVVHNVRPSCFVMSSFNRISFIESLSCSDSGSGEDTSEYELHNQTADYMGMCSSSGRNHSEKNHRNIPRKVSENSWLQSGSENMGASNVEQTEEKKNRFPMKRILQMETGWYTSPEEAAGAPSSCASDVYRLGVLLFEVSVFTETGDFKRLLKPFQDAPKLFILSQRNIRLLQPYIAELRLLGTLHLVADSKIFSLLCSPKAKKKSKNKGFE